MTSIETFKTKISEHKGLLKQLIEVAERNIAYGNNGEKKGK
jgi:hypothetical protein